MNHTPGPWTVADEWDGTSVKAGQFYVTHTIQSCGFHEPEDDKAITQANARLIAAAPELLACLIELASEYDHYTAEDIEYEISQGNQMIVPYQRVRAAIAKATGAAA